MLFGLFRRAANKTIVERLHGDIVATARQPMFYAQLGVADTFDGRFELLALFSTLVVRRLAGMPVPGPDLAQDLTDVIFTHLDDALREMGIGDIVVPKRIKKLAAALLGRRKAYDDALSAGDQAELANALSRNVYANKFGPGDLQTQRLVRYVLASQASLEIAPMTAFVVGPVPFPEIGSIA